MNDNYGYAWRHQESALKGHVRDGKPGAAAKLSAQSVYYLRVGGRGCSTALYSKRWSVRNRALGVARLGFLSGLRNRAFARLDFLFG